MESKFAFALIFFVALTARSADTITPLNVKPGLWEMSVTHSMSGAVPISDDKLAKLTPEQRARVEAAMGQAGLGAPATDVHKECVTKEKLEKDRAFGSDRKGCTRTILTSSSTKLEAKMHCEEDQRKTDGTLFLEVVSSDNVKGNMDATVSSGSRTMNMHFTFNSKYLGSNCGDVQP
jgi:hypothetical protein